MSLIERFLAKVEITEECWLWLGAERTKGRGYGGFRVDGKTVRAHRMAYEIFVGPLEPEQHLHHTCENRRCVNPEHLEIVTNAAHVASHRAGITHCKEGHPLVIRDTWNTPQKFCPICMREASRRYRERAR